VRNRVTSAVIAGLLLFGLSVTTASAQQPTSSDDYDLSVGALYGAALNEYSQTSNVGMHLDLAKRFLRDDSMNVAALGEIGFNHFESMTLSSYLGGIRFAGNYSRKFSPFAQFLLGVEHCCDETHFTIQPGGGIDVPWKAQFAFRAQVDWRHVNYEGDDADGLRVGVGVVFPLNR
jgi:hypothetical protein